MKIIGVERNKCEYPNCQEQAVILRIHPLSSGLNTHVLCEKHKNHNPYYKMKKLHIDKLSFQEDGLEE